MRQIAFVILALVLSVPASAHHSFAGFIMSDINEIEGELVGIKWRNPHLIFNVRVSDENGHGDIWTIVGWGSVYSMRRTGVKRDDFKIGERVKLVGYLSGVQKNQLLVSHMLLSSGVETLIRPDAEPRWSRNILGGRVKWAAKSIQLQNTAKENLGIFRVWSSSGYPGSLSTTKVNRTFTESAIAARADWDSLDNFVTRCELAGMPALMTQPHTYQFEGRGDKILLHGEVWNFTRTIEMNPSQPKLRWNSHNSVAPWATGKDELSLLRQTTLIGPIMTARVPRKVKTSK